MNYLKFSFLLIFAFLFLENVKVKAQELDATVIVNTDQLSQENKFNVSSMENDVRQYVNNQKFTKIDWKGSKIPIEISIHLSGGNKNVYSAKLFVIAKRLINGQNGGTSVTLKLIDQNWSFEYAQGASLTYNILRFDKFSSLIDYYCLVAIGFDMDTYGELEGTPVYDLAKQICLLGNSAGEDGYKTSAQPGEFTRYSLVNELSDMKYEEMRKLFFSYYVDGLDMMADNKEEGTANVEKFISDMVTFKKEKMFGPSVLLQAFFDSKAYEFAATFKGTSNKQVYKDLMYLDPSNTMIYEEARGK